LVATLNLDVTTEGDSAGAFVELFTTSTRVVAPLVGLELVLPTGLAHLTQTLFHYIPGLLSVAVASDC
jgi:NitT/TauT family transport system permease protein